MSAPDLWTTRGFLEHFRTVEKTIQDRRFCFVLGSGASKSSGIPTGGELVNQWLRELHTRHVHGAKEDGVEAWATADALGIKGFEYTRRAEFYPQVYARRFRGDPDEGYAFLEDVIGTKRPKFGYSILAQVLKETRHKVVITTNFDNLVADALSQYTRAFPLVCGHESLAQFVRVTPRRPLVVKIHRDWLLGPKSNPDEIAKLSDEWAAALKEIFKFYSPIVVGYGGNDGSLMGFLESLDPGSITGRLIWTFVGREPSDRIKALVARHNGCLVRIAGFDELMLQIGRELNLPLLDGELERRGKEMVDEYREDFKRFKDSVDAPPQAEPGLEGAQQEEQQAAKQAIKETLEAAKKENWWAWQELADQQTDPEKADAIYREGLEEFPDSAELTGNYARFLRRARKDYDAAERLYKRALELDPNNAINTGNYANFLADVRRDHDAAERLYKRALELDPKYALHIGNYARFLHDVRKDYDAAERLFKRALELDPNNAINTGNYARFLWRVRKDYDAAERLYKRALELDPNNAINTGNYANFLADVRRDHDAAERLYKRALELDPNNAINTGNYAEYLLLKGHLQEADALAARSWALSQKNDPPVPGLAFNRAILRSMGSQDEGPALGRIKSWIQSGPAPTTWSFDAVLEYAKGRLNPTNYAFYVALTDTLWDPSKAPTLNQFPKWRDVQPVPLDQPWPAETFPTQVSQESPPEQAPKSRRTARAAPGKPPVA